MEQKKIKKFNMLVRKMQLLFCNHKKGNSYKLKQIEDAAPSVIKFCSKHKTDILGIDCTDETGKLEPLYIFSDSCGGYTIEGINQSLDDYVRNK